ncbi:unnamed protein product [Sphenostylis stenocarpa]|uniref:Uncharacterized protein n=1 Tax=Sphenostylis stenocarpa TaxID=92480 RepID=A0AA86SJG9_9FABA|nr:unnamed protein product [Sphenostylis stenocarpa]
MVRGLGQEQNGHPFRVTSGTTHGPISTKDPRGKKHSPEASLGRGHPGLGGNELGGHLTPGESASSSPRESGAGRRRSRGRTTTIPRRRAPRTRIAEVVDFGAIGFRGDPAR